MVMTQDELDALPVTGEFGCEDREIDGKVVRIPVLVDVGVLWEHESDDGRFIDLLGDRWQVGWANGVRYKRRHNALTQATKVCTRIRSST